MPQTIETIEALLKNYHNGKIPKCFEAQIYRQNNINEKNQKLTIRVGDKITSIVINKERYIKFKVICCQKKTTVGNAIQNFIQDFINENQVLKI